MIVRGALAVALQHPDLDGLLLVLRRRKDVRLAHGDGRVLLDQFREMTVEGSDPQGHGSHVEQQQVSVLLDEYVALDGSAHRDHFVGIHTLVGTLAEEVRHLGLNHGHPCLATHENHVVDLVRRETRILHALGHTLEGLIDDIGDQTLQGFTVHRQIQMSGPVLLVGNEG